MKNEEIKKEIAIKIEEAEDAYNEFSWYDEPKAQFYKGRIIAFKDVLALLKRYKKDN